mmetsp:Transcript_72536/g.164604  ORF Transcript_72536/g.164604 Transcript_72536/m.164604 type:complete len:228 (-) Transcript_72536:183-866(-)
MARRKPISRSWSASSKMSTRKSWQSSLSPEFSMWSIRRPGVAIRTAGGDLCRAACSDLTLVPPTTHCTPKSVPWKVKSVRASSAVCSASSRVGDRHKTAIWPLGGGLRTSPVSTAGMRKPSVFPVPVLALATTSEPDRQGSMVCACTFVIVTYLNAFEIACLVGVETPSRSSNRSSVTASSVEEEVRDAIMSTEGFAAGGRRPRAGCDESAMAAPAATASTARASRC